MNFTTDLIFWSFHFGEKSPGSEKCFLAKDPSKLAGAHKKDGFVKSAVYKEKLFKKNLNQLPSLLYRLCKSFHLFKPQKSKIIKREPFISRLKINFVWSRLFVLKVCSINQTTVPSICSLPGIHF